MTPSSDTRARLRDALRPATDVVFFGALVGLLALARHLYEHGRPGAPFLLLAAVWWLLMVGPFFAAAVAFGLCRHFIDGSTRPLRKRWIICAATSFAWAATLLVGRSLQLSALVTPEEWAPILFFAAIGVVGLRFSRATRV